MDLGLAGSATVVTGGSKGMGLAIAQTLAAEGARVAVMARSRTSLDAAVESLRSAGAPDAVGIGVDMADAHSISAGFASVGERWGQLNALVHTIGPGDGYFEEMDDAEWIQCVFARHHVRGPVDPRRSSDVAIGRVGSHRHIVGAFDPAPEPADCRIHRVEGRPEQRHQESVEKPCQGRHSGELRLPRHHRHRQLYRGAQGHSCRRRSRCDESRRRDDLDRQQLSPAM